uniref:Uncharacterized protein n=1 Tax=Proschkinia sp. SZCZR1824 TaxID=2588390 RepID=A0A4Y5SFY2_9STRA|nr:hypothetical protein [Proschkinia sp. SZCZR1824]
MEFSSKYYKVFKTKAYLKNDFFVFYSGVHKNSTEWLKTEQEFKKLKLAYYKGFNKTTKLLLNKSIYKTADFLIGSLTFFFKPTQFFTIKSLFQLDLFILLGIKTNKNFFSSEQIKQVYSSDYQESVLLLYQFKVIGTKIYFKK